jgi:creatinine amidohydrolase
MKPPTVFLGEMTNPEVEAFVKKNRMVIVPTGAVEQHGPHGPLLTDVLIPNEVARRAAPKLGAAVAPPISYALSYPHKGFTGVVYLRMETFRMLVEDIAIGLATMGFKRIVFLNGHYDNTYALAYACASAADRLPADARAFPINYWDGMPPDVMTEYASLEKGMHANAAETSAVMRINPDLVDLDKANAEFPPFPPFRANAGAVHTAFFFSNPGSVYWATKSGTWGDARQSSAEMGERYLEASVASTILVLDNIEQMFAAMPARP